MTGPSATRRRTAAVRGSRASRRATLHAAAGRAHRRTNRRTTLRTALRAGLLLFAAVEGTVGAWATLAPRAFYDGFPLPGHGWLTMLPPYNQHFIVDFGALNLALAVLLAVSARHLDPLLVRTGLTAYLVFTVPHLAFHATHMAHTGAAIAAVQLGSLVIAVAGPLALLAIAPRPGSRRPARHQRHAGDRPTADLLPDPPQ